jgi:hypothetical protein
MGDGGQDATDRAQSRQCFRVGEGVATADRIANIRLGSATIPVTIEAHFFDALGAQGTPIGEPRVVDCLSGSTDCRLHPSASEVQLTTRAERGERVVVLLVSYALREEELMAAGRDAISVDRASWGFLML